MRKLEFKEHGYSEVALIKDENVMNISIADEKSFVSLRLGKIELAILITSLTSLLHGEY